MESKLQAFTASAKTTDNMAQLHVIESETEINSESSFKHPSFKGSSKQKRLSQNKIEAAFLNEYLNT